MDFLYIVHGIVETRHEQIQ